jgi:drug/metabolite transporter (DMT)-like permease
MAIGATLLFSLALLTAEPLTLPSSPATWASLLYLALVGSVGLFMLTLYVLARWSASATAYATLAMPLVTLVMAVALGQERFTLRGLVGALVALSGITVIVGDQLREAVPLASLVSILIGVSFIALSNVVVKQIPPGHPVAANALGMAIGAAVLLALALLAEEPRTIPESPTTWASLLYLALVGSVGLFMLTLYVLARWTASATAYATLAMPLVTVVVAAVLLGESVGPLFLVGASLVVFGVYVGISASGSRGDSGPESNAETVPG